MEESAVEEEIVGWWNGAEDLSVDLFQVRKGNGGALG